MKKNVYRALKMVAFYSIKGLLLQVFFVNLLFGMTTTDAQKLDKIKISLDITNVTLQEAFNDIEQKTNLNFIYISEEISLNNRVSLSFDKAPVEEILKKLSEDMGLSFSQFDNYIVVKKINVKKDNSDKNVNSDKDAKGGMKGTIKGSDTKSALPYAIVMVDGTNNGTSADVDGNYILRNIPQGKHQISISYVGYKSKKIDVVIKPDQIIETNVTLEITSVEGQEVVVTAQRAGQQVAINDQIQSNVIKNVVAADRLQENPDANSAEALGRLPGVSLIRSGGEGTGVVIRGLDPKYSTVMLDGIQLPTTNISGISQYVLQGVEVFKSITPDMEGNSVAGTINLKLNEAPSGMKYSIMAQGGYNDLNDYWKNFKLQGDISNRFFNDKLGIMVNLNAERVNRSAQTLSAGYETKTVSSSGLVPLFVNSINLNDQKRINNREAGSLVLDYKLSPVTKLFFSNFYSHTDQNYTGVSKTYGISDGTVWYYINDIPHNYSELYSGSLKSEHQFQSFELDEGIAFSQSHAYTPESRTWASKLATTGLSKYGDETTESLPLSQILAGANDSRSSTSNFELTSLYRNADDIIDKHIDSYINAKVPISLGNDISGYVKFGGKYKANSRLRNYDSRYQDVSSNLIPNWGEYAANNIPWAVETSTKGLSMSGLDDYTVNNFLKGQYNFGWYPNISRLNEIFNWWSSYSNYYLNVDPSSMPAAFSNGKIGYRPNWQAIKQNSQKVTEFYYAGYLMSELNYGDMISFIPGVRYEKVKDNLGGWWMESVSYYDIYNAPGYSTDSTHNDEYLLPMAHLKIKPANWFQALFSFTQTLNRPDYSQLVPNVYLNRGSGTKSYSSGNPDLKPEFWTNYDAQFAVFGDKIGLFSVSGFYKKVKDMIWTPVLYRTSGQPWLFGNTVGQYFSDNSTVVITVPQNHSFAVYLKGLEFEMQTNLWYLPEPFNYISLDINFTLINSETKYEYSKTSTVVTGYTSKGVPITKLVTTDSVYSGPMLNQPKSIANFSFGYNYKGFNLWLSYQYTGAMITSEPNLKELENQVSKFAKWDLQITQKLPIEGLEALFNYANINNPMGYQNNLADSRATYMESYGWTFDLGLRYRL